MPDYSKGMIYMLEPTIHYEECDIYYGSTTQPLHKRFYEHKHIFDYDKPGKSKKNILKIWHWKCQNYSYSKLSLWK